MDGGDEESESETNLNIGQTSVERTKALGTGGMLPRQKHRG